MDEKFVAIAVEPKTRDKLKKIAAAKRTKLYQLVLTLAEQAEKNLQKNINIDKI